MIRSFTTSLYKQTPPNNFTHSQAIMNKKDIVTALFSMLLLALLFIAPTTAYAQSESEQDILDTAIEAGDFRVLVAYLKASGLDETLKGEGPFTIFAPSDSAFVKIPLPKIRELRDDPDGDLTDILLYHAVEGRVTAVDILDLIDTDLTSVNGLDLTLSEKDGVVMINNAAIITTDIEASNGIIHVIDSVLVPSAIEETWNADESADEMTDDDAADGDESADEMADESAAEGDESADEMDDDAAVEGDESADEMTDEDAADEDESADEMDDDAAVEGDESADEMTDDAAAEGDESTDEMTDENAADEDESADEMDDDAAAEDDESTDEMSDDAAVDEDESADASSTNSVAAAPVFNILDTANNAGTFTTLVAAVYTANLNETLQSDGPFTLFAPSDSAFATMPAGTVQALLDLPIEELSKQLLLHVVPGELMAEDIVQLVNSDIETASGELLPIRADETGLVVGNALMVATNIQTTNGIIHIIDGMLDQSAFGELASITAPPAAAAAPVAEPTVAAPAAASASAAPTSVSRGADLVDTAVAAGNFNTLVTAIKAAELDEILRTGESFTIFAPTDEAFAALQEGKVDSLLADPTGALTDILLYHIVEGLLPADYIVSIDGSSLKTVSGNLLSIEVNEDGDVLIGGAKVVATNIGAMNGLIHVIDRVLTPPTSSSAAPAAPAAPASTAVPAPVTPVATTAAAPTQSAAPTVEATPIVPATPPATPSIEDAIEEVVQEVEREYSCLLYYVVDPGDTLFGIALTYASTVSMLMDANGLSDPDDIKSGQSLCIVR